MVVQVNRVQTANSTASDALCMGAIVHTSSGWQLWVLTASSQFAVRLRLSRPFPKDTRSRAKYSFALVEDPGIPFVKTVIKFTKHIEGQNLGHDFSFAT